MTTIIAAQDTRPHAPDRPSTLLQIARAALLAAGAGTVWYLARTLALSQATLTGLAGGVLVLGTVAAAAFVLRWGIGLRSRVARWTAVACGLLMTAFFFGPGAVLIDEVWRFEFSLLEVLRLGSAFATVFGFVVAGACCAGARTDTAGWR